MARSKSFWTLACLSVASFAFAPANAQAVLNDWASVKTPQPPFLKAVTADPKTTALLLFDFTTQTCSVERRPRCAASVPKLKKLLTDARARGVFVVYSVAIAGTGRADILADIKPNDTDPVLPPLGPDKFLNSDFEKTLRDKGIQTVIITGTAAQSTVLHTGGEAALRGFKVIAPVDGMSSNDAFPELYTAWHLANSARVMDMTTLTAVDMIDYKK
jgi:nicotinamidase-related amidase